MSIQLRARMRNGRGRSNRHRISGIIAIITTNLITRKHSSLLLRHTLLLLGLLIATTSHNPSPLTIGGEFNLLDVLNLSQNLLEEAVNDERVVRGRAVAHRTQPAGFLLVHEEVGLEVEALHVFAVTCASWQLDAEFY